jgi:hypothetical protein
MAERPSAGHPRDAGSWMTDERRQIVSMAMAGKDDQTLADHDQILSDADQSLSDIDRCRAVSWLSGRCDRGAGETAPQPGFESGVDSKSPPEGAATAGVSERARRPLLAGRAAARPGSD